MKYLLSIDGATHVTGYALFSIETKKIITYGIIKSNDQDSMRLRVVQMIDGIYDLIKVYNPSQIVMEDVPPAINNSSTVLSLGILSGGILGLAHSSNIPIQYVSVSTWHSALQILKSTGDIKKQSIENANKKYRINLLYFSPNSKKNQDNEADAINIGRYFLGDFSTEKYFKKGVHK
jgi:Holliday junction resolvasome RuvABC endonuclease subunit